MEKFLKSLENPSAIKYLAEYTSKDPFQRSKQTTEDRPHMFM